MTKNVPAGANLVSQDGTTSTSRQYYLDAGQLGPSTGDEKAAPQSAPEPEIPADQPRPPTPN